MECHKWFCFVLKFEISFQFYEYALVTKLVENNRVLYFCNCETYGILMAAVHSSHGQNEWDGITCLHCRLLEELQSEVCNIMNTLN